MTNQHLPRPVDRADLEPDFASILERVEADTLSLFESLRAHFRPPWSNQVLTIAFVDDPDLNAQATTVGSRDAIVIQTGTIEFIYGAMLELMSMPMFLPLIGDASSEHPPNVLDYHHGLPRMPLLRSPLQQGHPICRVPQCATRSLTAFLLADLATAFLMFHEVGHLAGNHALLPNRALPRVRRLCEIDADAFACHVTALAQTSAGVVDSIEQIVTMAGINSRDTALVTYLTAIHVLFRILTQCGSYVPDAGCSTHPSPAVRTHIVAAATLSREMHYEKRPLNALTDVAQTSVLNVEETWGAAALPGQLPLEDMPTWQHELQRHTSEHLHGYLAMRPEFDAVARLRRAWDDIGD